MSQKGFNTGSNTIIAKKPFSFLELYPSSKVGHSLSLSLTWCENYLKVRHRSNLPLFSLSPKKSHRSSIFVIILCRSFFSSAQFSGVRFLVVFLFAVRFLSVFSVSLWFHRFYSLKVFCFIFSLIFSFFFWKIIFFEKKIREKIKQKTFRE